MISIHPFFALTTFLVISALSGCANTENRQWPSAQEDGNASQAHEEVVLKCHNDHIEKHRAFVEPKCITSAVALTKQINQRENVPIPEGESWFKVIKGNVPIIVTAPHATRPLREGKRRFADGGGTAALAIAIGQLTGASVIFTTYEGPSDPNYYDDNAFKEALAQLIESEHPTLILDIHGSHPFRSYDIDFGTMRGRSLLGRDEILKTLMGYLEKEGILNFSHNRFGASKYETITKFGSAHGVPTIQLEINANWISPDAGNPDAHRFSKMTSGLSRFILETQL